MASNLIIPASVESNDFPSFARKRKPKYRHVPTRHHQHRPPHTLGSQPLLQPTPRNTQRIGSWLCARRTREHVLGAEVIVGRCWSGRGGQGQCGWRNCSQ